MENKKYKKILIHKVKDSAEKYYTKKAQLFDLSWVSYRRLIGGAWVSKNVCHGTESIQIINKLPRFS